MALEYWSSPAYGRDQAKIAHTRLVWDSKAKDFIEVQNEPLIPEEELARRKKEIPPLVVYR